MAAAALEDLHIRVGGHPGQWRGALLFRRWGCFSTLAKQVNQLHDEMSTAFENIKLSKKIQWLDNIYEVYDGIYQLSKQPICIVVLLNCQEATTKSYLKIKSPTVMHPIEMETIGSDEYLAFEKGELLTLRQYCRRNELCEEDVWDLIRELVHIAYIFYKKMLVVNIYDPELIFIDGRKEIHFMSIHGISLADDKTKNTEINQYYTNYDADIPYAEDLYNIGALVLDLLEPQPIPRVPHPHVLSITQQTAAIEQLNFSVHMEMMLSSLLDPEPSNRPTMEALFQHPILFSYRDENPSSILNYTKPFSLSDFRMVRELGEGTYGACDLAIFNPSGEKVVLKQTLEKQSNDVEAKIMKSITHPNIVSFIGSFSEGRVYYIIIQYCEEGDLFDYLTASNTDYSEEDIFRWMAETCSALYYMHDQNYIHRDIKPQNLLMSHNNLLFADFGVSREIETAASTLVGTPLYFSPEQFFQQKYDSSADIFALGLVFLNIILGSHPFVGEKREISKFFNTVKQEGNCDKYCDLIENYNLRKIVSKMLQFDPKMRITAARICKEGPVQFYIKLLSLPGPGQDVPLQWPGPQIVVQRPLTEIVGNCNQCKNAGLSTLSKLRGQLGRFAGAATHFLPWYCGCLYTALTQKRASGAPSGQLVAYVLAYILQDSFDAGFRHRYANKHRDFVVQNAPENRACSLQIVVSSTVSGLPKQHEHSTVIYITPALVVRKNVTIECDDLVVVANNIVVEQDCCLFLKKRAATFIYNKSYGEHLKIESKKGSVTTVGPDVANISIDAREKVVEREINDPGLKCLLKLVFYSFKDKFKKNTFKMGYNEWAGEESTEDEELSDILSD